MTLLGALGFGLVTLSGCGSANSFDTPPLAPLPSEPEKKSWFSQTSEDAWNAVASPVSGIIPKSSPKMKPVEEAGVSDDPPEMVIMSKENRGMVEEPAPK